jgi:hypothetical protein
MAAQVRADNFCQCTSLHSIARREWDIYSSTVVRRRIDNGLGDSLGGTRRVLLWVLF